jgi:hypothetical protein
VNSVVINPIGHIFAGAVGTVFRSMNDADQWTDVSSGLLPPGGNVWAVATRGLPPEDLSLPERLLAWVFRSLRSAVAVQVAFGSRGGSPNASTAALRVC